MCELIGQSVPVAEADVEAERNCERAGESPLLWGGSAAAVR